MCDFGSHFGTIVESFWDHFGVILGAIRVFGAAWILSGRPWTLSGSFWAPRGAPNEQKVWFYLSKTYFF